MPYISAKEPYIFESDAADAAAAFSALSANQPFVYAEEPYISAKESYKSTKEP